MNARKKGDETGRSRLTGNRQLRAFDYAHNPFSVNSHKDPYADDYKKDDDIWNLGAMDLQVEMAKAEANLLAYNLVAWHQKS